MAPWKISLVSKGATFHWNKCNLELLETCLIPQKVNINTLGCPPSQDASGKWRFRLGSPTKNITIFVVTLTGQGDNPINTPKNSHISKELYKPGTQMTLVLIGKGLVLGGWPSKIEVIWVPGIPFKQPIHFGCRHSFVRARHLHDAIEDDMGERPPVSMRKVNLSGAILRDWRRFPPVFSLTTKGFERKSTKQTHQKNGAERDRFFLGGKWLVIF